MPRPSRFIADQFREVDESLAGVDKSGEVEAQSLQTLAKGMEQFGRGIESYQRARAAAQSAQVRNSSAVVALEAHRAGLQAIEEETHPDGHDASEVYERRFNEIYGEHVDFQSSDEYRDQAQNIGDTMRIKFATEVDQKEREQFQKYYLDQAAQSERGMVNAVFLKPELFSETLQSHNDFVNASITNGSLPAELSDEVRQRGIRRILNSAVDGMLENKQWDKALEDIKTGRFSMLLTVEEKKTLIKKVKDSRKEFVSTEMQEDSFEEMKLNRAEEKIFKDNRQKYVNQINEAVSPAQKRDIIKRMNQDLALGLLDEKDYNFQQKLLNSEPVDEVTNSRTQLEYIRMINRGVDGDEVRASLDNDLGVLIDSPTAIVVENALNARDSKENSVGKQIYRRKVNSGNTYLNNLIINADAITESIEQLTGDERKRVEARGQAEEFYNQFLLKYPQLEPRQAAILAGHKAIGKTFDREFTISGVSHKMMNDEDALREEFKKTMVKAKGLGNTTADNTKRSGLLDRAKNIKERIFYLRAREELDEGLPEILKIINPPATTETPSRASGQQSPEEEL